MTCLLGPLLAFIGMLLAFKSIDDLHAVKMAVKTLCPGAAAALLVAALLAGSGPCSGHALPGMPAPGAGVPSASGQQPVYHLSD
jgi:hypothetical protein